jgi:Rhodopirellula transposase DDE domain
MELTDDLKATYIETAKQLKGSERRKFMARIVKSLKYGGQRQAERELGWDRNTIRKGTRELERGIDCVDAYSARGRKRAEEHLPHLLDDMRTIVDGQSQTDATFATNRLYTRLSVAEVRRQLIVRKGYTEAELPCEETLRVKLNAMDYHLRPVRKSQPQKKSRRLMPSSTS